jgi:asparagine synthase (glutamine-hydrolysing)
MLSYVAFSWNPHSPQERVVAKRLTDRVEAMAERWEVLLNLPGLFAASRRGHFQYERALRVGPRGLLLGTVFETVGDQNAVPLTNISDPLAKRIDESRGRHLVSHFWGSYVLLLTDEIHSSARAFRGPMSALSCHYMTLSGVCIYFSSIDDCLDICQRKLTINWPFIQAQTTRGDYLNNQTGLNEVTTLNCGECLVHVEGRVTTEIYWSPTEYARSHYETKMSFEDATSEYRRTVGSCVRSWASLHDSVLHQLSGGLDSSIVLACLLADHDRPGITCINFYSRGSGDERSQARSIANSNGLEMLENERDQSIDLRMFLTCARSVMPVLNFSACFCDPVLSRLSRANNATTVFTGELGDNVFGQGLSHEAVHEYRVREGINAGLFQTALNAARLGRKSVWSVLDSGLRDTASWVYGPHWSLYSFSRGKGDGRLAAIESLKDYESRLDSHLHPWFRNTSDAPPGLFRLILGLVLTTSASFDSPFLDKSATSISAPLGSQPLVELSLRTPSYLHIHAGLDRSVARCAFKSELPDVILNRGTAKGTPELWIKDTVQKNRAFLREVLLDGILVSKGYLDRTKLEDLLSGDVNRSSSYVSEVFQQLYIEAWARQWEATEQRAAA